MHHLAFMSLLGLVIHAAVADNHCHKDVTNHCSSTPPDENIVACNALYSGVDAVMGDLQDYTLQHLLNSYQYLLMSANFANYERQREGFAKLFKKLSDDTWDDAIDIIKYMTKRGGAMNMSSHLFQSNVNLKLSPTLEMTEPESVSLALDSYKVLAHKSHEIHGKVSKNSYKQKEIHDADVISFIENKFVKKHSEIIRELSGHTNDLMNLIKTSTNEKLGVAIYLFDDYLKSLY